MSDLNFDRLYLFSPTFLVLLKNMLTLNKQTFPPGFNASLGAIFQDLLPLKGVDPNDPVLMMIVAQPKVLNALKSMEGPGIESSFKGQSNF